MSEKWAFDIEWEAPDIIYLRILCRRPLELHMTHEEAIDLFVQLGHVLKDMNDHMEKPLNEEDEN